MTTIFWQYLFKILYHPNYFIIYESAFIYGVHISGVYIYIFPVISEVGNDINQLELEHFFR